MSATIDHLRVDHRVTVLRDFTDANGTSLRKGEEGVIRRLGFNSLRREISIELQRSDRMDTLTFLLGALTGPRNGHMRDYFEVREDVEVRQAASTPRHGSRKMKAVPRESGEESGAGSRTAGLEPDPAGPDKLTDVEEALQRAYPHIGAAASIAEMYARRMRHFQRAGNETRAVAAFRLAVGWMDTYASWATSGGEGIALSRERDEFRRALAHELGYDPDSPEV